MAGLRDDVNELKDDFKASSSETRQELKELSNGINRLELLIAGNYTTKEDFETCTKNLRKEQYTNLKKVEEGLDKRIAKVEEGLDKKAEVNDCSTKEKENSSFHKFLLTVYATFLVTTVSMFYYIFSLIGTLSSTINNIMNMLR